MNHLNLGRDHLENMSKSELIDLILQLNSTKNTLKRPDLSHLQIAQKKGEVRTNIKQCLARNSFTLADMKTDLKYNVIFNSEGKICGFSERKPAIPVKKHSEIPNNSNETKKKTKESFGSSSFRQFISNLYQGAKNNARSVNDSFDRFCLKTDQKFFELSKNLTGRASGLAFSAKAYINSGVTRLGRSIDKFAENLGKKLENKSKGIFGFIRKTALIGVGALGFLTLGNLVGTSNTSKFQENAAKINESKQKLIDLDKKISQLNNNLNLESNYHNSNTLYANFGDKTENLSYIYLKARFEKNRFESMEYSKMNGNSNNLEKREKELRELDEKFSEILAKTKAKAPILSSHPRLV